MAKDNDWMEKASEKMKDKGTKGSFSKAAHKAGKSTAAFAKKEAHAPGKMGKRARFAEVAEKAAKHK